MKAIGDIEPGECGWMDPLRVYLTPDGNFYADVHASVLDDRERNASWMDSDGTRDATDAPVERTPEGALVVDAGGFKRVPFTTVETVAGLDVLPIGLRAPGTDLEPCDGCGEAFGRADLIPAEDGGGVYCETCYTVIPGEKEDGTCT